MDNNGNATSLSNVTVGAFEVYGGTQGTDYEYADNVLTIKTNASLMIKNTDQNTATTTDRIKVADGIFANITLAGINIDVSGTDNACAFKIEDNSEGNVTITLADGSVNTLKSGVYCAGLQKNGNYISDDKGKLTIKGDTNGTGKLTADGGYSSAGIGGGSVLAAGTNTNDIGNHYGAVTPTNGTDDVYLLTIANPDGDAVYIDGSETPYAPSNHSAAGTGDEYLSLYAYLTGETHKVKIGDEETEYKFCTDKFLPVPNEGKRFYFHSSHRSDRM